MVLVDGHDYIIAKTLFGAEAFEFSCLKPAHSAASRTHPMAVIAILKHQVDGCGRQSLSRAIVPEPVMRKDIDSLIASSNPQISAAVVFE